jgi:site-specific DNA-methyltransferase (adenine-specific)
MTFMEPVHQTSFGELYHGDCLDLMRLMDDGSVDLVFADPPFNLGKDYGKKVNDSLAEERYLSWCREAGLTFRHWVAIDIKFSLPIPGRLYPSHYSLLYYTKGKPARFLRPRLPIPACRHCGGDIKDYGGHRDKLHPDGINLTDVWLDIPPVRHRSTKQRGANELSTKLLQRVLEISSDEGDLVFDPFGGSGTTYFVAERMKRRWIGVELGDVEPIIRRLRGEKPKVQLPNRGDSRKGMSRKTDDLPLFG